jgi:penicillin amidase
VKSFKIFPKQLWENLMKKIFLSVFLTLFVLGGAWLYYRVDSSKPPLEGNIQIKGLEKPVFVTRDHWGIPHIEAQNEMDLHRALGFVMASDRLFQMDLLRRIANGQLSEILGEKALKFDILLRTLRLRGHMDDFWEKNRHKLDPHMLKLMDAFLAGVHAYIQTRPLPPEFLLLGYRPKPFTMTEAMGISGYLALSFAEGLLADPLYTDLLDEFPQEEVAKLFIRHQNDRNIVTEPSGMSFNLNESKWYSDLLETHDFFRDVLGLFHGSNSWVLGPKRSKSGFPILANDPHVAFSNPGIWYEAHLKSPEYEIYGHFVPMVPFPVMGHDQQRGWAVTMTEIDDLDLYREKINPKNPNQVMFKNEWVEMKHIKETIKVRGGKDKKIIIKMTPHGPLIDDTQYGHQGLNLAVKWSFHHPENDIATAFYKLSRSKKLEDLPEAIKHGATPGINVSWVDKEGNIAWKVLGKIPLRRDFRGNQLLEGWSGRHEYERYFTIDENPGLTNPEDGVIVTANYHPQYNGDLPIDGYWQPSERFERIYDLLKQKEKWTLKEMEVIQNDQFVVTADWMVPILIGAIDNPSNQMEKEALSYLRKWKGNSDRESIGSSIFHMWTHYVGKQALLDELGEKRFVAFNKIADFWNFFKTFIKESESPWWDNIKTAQKEGRRDIIQSAFKKSLAVLKSRFGEDMSQWQWGKQHTVEYEHPLGKARPLNKIFNLGPYPAGGGYFQVDNMSTARYDDRFHTKLGPSTRRLIDYKDPVRSWGILPTGNSGHLLSPFYKDQAQAFLNGQYRPQYLSIEDVRKKAHHLLKLLPAN